MTKGARCRAPAGGAAGAFAHNHDPDTWRQTLDGMLARIEVYDIALGPGSIAARWRRLAARTNG